MRQCGPHPHAWHICPQCVKSQMSLQIPRNPQSPTSQFVVYLLNRRVKFSLDTLISQLAFLCPCLLSLPSGVSGRAPESGRINNTKVWSVPWMDVWSPESGFHFPDKKAPGGCPFLLPSNSFRGESWNTRRTENKKRERLFYPGRISEGETGKLIRTRRPRAPKLFRRSVSVVTSPSADTLCESGAPVTLEGRTLPPPVRGVLCPVVTDDPLDCGYKTR